MKPTRSSTSSECKTNEMSIADLSRLKLPRLQKPVKKAKKGVVRVSVRNDRAQSKYDQLVEEILEFQSCVRRKYGTPNKKDGLSLMQKSISALNQEISIVSRNICSKSAKEPAIRSTSSSDIDEVFFPATKEHSKWSRRLQFRPRSGMANRALIVLNFEGVVGDVFKDNIWSNQSEKLHLRKGTNKGLRELLENFQIVLFFHRLQNNYERILSYFSSKSIVFDGVYTSENSNQWTLKSQGRFKKPMKYSEHIQNYSQISLDFCLQHEVLGRMLIVTSICLEQEEHFKADMNLIIKNFNTIPQYLW